MQIIGTLSGDNLTGSDDADTIYGGGTESASSDRGDTIYGAAGNDLIYGNGGADRAYGEAGQDTLYGGADADTLYGGNAVFNPDDEADSIIGGSGADVLYGNGGADTLRGGDTNDTIYGGYGNDLIYGGDPFLSSGDGSDVIIAGPGQDVVEGGIGHDTIFGGTKVTNPDDDDDTLSGGEGNDVIYGNGGHDLIYGNNGDDTLYGGNGNDTLDGGEGADSFYSASGTGDLLQGKGGTDAYILYGDILGGGSLTTIEGAQADELITLRGVNGLGTLAALTSGSETIVTYDGQAIMGLSDLQTQSLNFAFSSIDGTSSNAAVEVVTFSLTISGTGGSNSSSGGSAPNTAPVLYNLDAITYLENTINAGASLVDSTIGLTDNANGLSGGSVTFTYSSGGGAEDQLSLNNAGVGAGQIGFDGTTVTYEGTAIATVNGGNNGSNGNDLILDLNGSATLTNTEALIEALTYQNTSDTPTATRTLSITVNDGAQSSAAQTAVITVTAENDAPVLTNLDAPTAFMENAINASAQSIDTSVSVSDAEDADFDTGNLTVTYSSGGGAEDQLTINNIGTGAGQIGFDGTTATYGGTTIGTVNGANNGANGVDLIIDLNSNATTAATKALIEALTYQNTSNTPTANRTISITINDGNDTSTADTAVITVTAQDEPQTLTGDATANALNGGSGADTLTGGYNGDTIDGGADADVIYADNQQFDPTTYGDIRIWLDANDSDSITRDGSDRVSQWNDKSANTNHASQGTSADEPLYVLGAVNGRPGINYDGVNEYLQGGPVGISGSDASTSFIVAVVDTFNGGGDRIFQWGKDGGAGGLNRGFDLANPAFRFNNGNRIFEGDDLTVGQTHITTWFNDDAYTYGQHEFWLDGLAGTQTSSGNSGTLPNVTDEVYTVGRGMEGAPPNQFTDGSSAEFLIFAEALNATQRDEVEQYLSLKYGTTLDGYTLGADQLTGGAGDDIFVWTDASYSLGGNIDSITDFKNSGDGDVIYFSFTEQITIGGNAALSSTLNELVWNDDSTDTTIELDRDGDGDADFEIELTGYADASTLSLTDFTFRHLQGGGSSETINGGAEDDTLLGGGGHDTISGAAGADIIRGEADDDSIVGGAGNDTLDGGTGADSLNGGDGNDVFDYDAAGESSTINTDVVTIDWDADTIDISGIGTDAGDTINTVGGLTINSLADVVTNYDNTNMDQIGDANILTATAGTLSGNSYLIISTDGNATYDEGTDLFIQVIATGTFDVTDIV